jgi:hypothetical protein
MINSALPQIRDTVSEGTVSEGAENDEKQRMQILEHVAPK